MQARVAARVGGGGLGGGGHLDIGVLEGLRDVGRHSGCGSRARAEAMLQG